MRDRGSGLLLWVGSSSTRGGHPPYFAAKAGMDALAESYAAEVVKYGIETTILVPGAYPSGTNHFAHAGRPEDTERESAYADAYDTLGKEMLGGLTAAFPAGRTADEVADEIVRVVDEPAGRRPFRVHVDPSHDGSEVVSVVYDRVRAEFYRRIGIAELLPASGSR